MKKLFVALTLLVSFNSYALPLSMMGRVLGNKIQNQIKLYQNVLDQESNYVELNQNDAEIYYLKRIRFEVIPYVSFDVPFFEGKVFPIIEFRWTRANPQGYVNYRR
jgi:hypothetical protein